MSSLLIGSWEFWEDPRVLPYNQPDRHFGAVIRVNLFGNGSRLFTVTGIDPAFADNLNQDFGRQFFKGGSFW